MSEKKGCGCVIDSDGNTVKECSGAEVPALIGRAPCGCALYAGVLDGNDWKEMADVSRDARRLERKGWTIERRTVGWVRHGGLNFDCPHRKKPRAADKPQPRLPL